MNDHPCLWRLELFGGFRARRLGDENQAPLERFRTQKAASLLAFLAFHRKTHRRETLCDLFWPDLDLPKSRNNLRVSLSALRALLEPEGVPEGAALQISRDTVALGPAVETDIALFQLACNQARQAHQEQANQETERRAALEIAVSLYRGPLLRGQACEWMMGEDGRLEDIFAAAFTALITLLEASGEATRALDVARAAVTAAPSREEAIRETLRLGLRLGQSAQVAREWEAWQKRAVRDGISVGEATMELARNAQKAPISNLLVPNSNSSRTAFTSNTSQSELERPTPPRNRGTSLPAQWTNFFGRTTDIETIQGWLRQPTNQLITITGPGGGGKTRLALEIARSFIAAPPESYQPNEATAKEPFACFDWVEWRSLANLPSAQLLPGAILDVLRAPRGDGSLKTLIAALEKHIHNSGDARMLLVLDNFEHLCDEGAPMIHALLEAVPELVCLITSRRRLGFAGEREWPLQPLDTPAFEAPLTTVLAARDGAEGRTGTRIHNGDQRYSNTTNDTQSLNGNRNGSGLNGSGLRAASSGPVQSQPASSFATSASVQLFLDRARMARPGFNFNEISIEVVARLCAYLDGMPLALELAAARVALFSPAQILAGVEQHMESSAAAGESSAQIAPLDWVNHDRAAPERHRSLRAAISWSEQQLPHNAARFWSRLSIFRGGWTLEAAAYVCEEPDAAPLVLTLRDVSLISLDTRTDTPRGHQLEALREYASEGLESADRAHIAARHARYFLNWAETVKPHLDGARVTYYLNRLETERDNLREAYNWHLEHDIEGALRLAVALHWSWELRGRVEEGRVALIRTLKMAREAFPDLEERAQHHSADRRRLHLFARTHNGAGKLATVARDIVSARFHLEESLRLFRVLGDDFDAADCLYSLGYMHLKSGNVDEARSLCDESVAIYRNSHDNAALCDALYNRALVALYECDFEMVRALNNERLTIHRAAGEKRGVAISLESLGLAALFSGEVEAARVYFTESLSIFEAIAEWFSVARVLWGLGHVARAAGHQDEAQQAFLQALQLARDSQTHWTLPYILEALAYLTTDATELKDANNGSTPPDNETQRLAARATRLLGAASLLRETHDEPMPNPVFHQQFDEAIAVLHATLSPAHFESEWQLGRTFSPEAMISFAFEN